MYGGPPGGCGREVGYNSPRPPAVFLLGRAIPGKHSSPCSDLGTGVCIGSTDTTDLIGKTRSSADGFMKGESDRDEKGELPVGV